jgi:hypothetical protein
MVIISAIAAKKVSLFDVFSAKTCRFALTNA